MCMEELETQNFRKLIISRPFEEIPDDFTCK